MNLFNFYGLCTLDQAYDWWVDSRYHGGTYFGRFCDKLRQEGWLIQ